MKSLKRGMGLILGNVLLLACASSQALASTSAATTSDQKSDTHLNAQQYFEILGSAVSMLQQHFVDSIDWSKVMRAGIDAMLGELDPYTEFYTEEDQSEFKTMTTGEYGGIGSIIQQNGDSVIISQPYEDMPAAKAGLLPGDVILAIDGESAIKKSTSQVSEKLRGQAGTSFELTYLRPYETEPRKVTVTRKKIVMDAVPYYGWLNDSVAYIGLTNFTDKAAQEVQKALFSFRQDKQRQMKGLIVDLRSNPGGLLDEAVKIVGMFVPKGSLVVETKAKTPDWNSSYVTTTSPIEPDVRMVTLVDRNSASASEILSGSLQDLDRSVIMGERSFGKGLVQSTRQLPYNTLMKFTSAKYYIPSGRCIQAIDYALRRQQKANANPQESNADLGRIPDSLTHVFHTAAGREVRDGGGIKPDIESKSRQYSNLTYYLEHEYQIFRYATKYRHEHATIAPANEFTITEQDYADFCKTVMATRKDTILKALKIDSLAQQLDSLKGEVMDRLNHDIVTRYYYQRGQAHWAVEHDTTVLKAANLLADEKSYRDILKAPVIDKKEIKKGSKGGKKGKASQNNKEAKTNKAPKDIKK